MFRRLAAALALTALAAGACAPAKPKGPPANLTFKVKDLAGHDVALADFKGRPMVINFWATFCGPCKAEMPALIDLAEKYRSRNLVVLGISIADTPAEIQQFAAAFDRKFPSNYPLLVGATQDAFLEAYNASEQIPVTWFVRADGTVSAKSELPQTRDWFDTQIRAMF
jgi:thiol-disulfide isomerase/thioredoxin